MEFLYLISDVQKHIFKEIIIKAAFAETSLYLFNLKKVLNKLPLLPRCHGSGHELEYNVLNRVVIEEGYVRVTMRG
jgi:hypothetical protein